jgi:hypothetical protein
MGKQIWIKIVLLCVWTGVAGCIEVEKVATVSPTAVLRTELTHTPISSSTRATVPTATQIPAATQPMPTPIPKQLPTASIVPPVAEAYYEDRTGPTSLLASYYNAINRREYARAWSYWQNPPNSSYADFIQGFADTASVFLTLRPPILFEGAAGSTYTSIPVLLNAVHLDGSQHNFVGCFVTRRSNIEEPGIAHEWSLYDATVHPTLGNSTDALLLDQACGPLLVVSYDDQTSPVCLLTSYYNAINLKEYARAWDYWENPPDPTFEDFEKGFVDTGYVMLVVNPPVSSEGAAGSVYVAIPALISAEHTDGSQHNFVGCFIARQSNVDSSKVEQLWSLFEGKVQHSPNNTTDITVLKQVCEMK